MFRFRRVTASDVLGLEKRDFAEDLGVAQIIRDIELHGEEALLAFGEKFGDIDQDAPYMLSRTDLEDAFSALPIAQQQLLERVGRRIANFAQAQKDCLKELDVSIPGGIAGHRLQPIYSAGCYAPGGRFPLPSSVLMTAIPARVAGVQQICVASPRPQPIMLGAAFVAGADQMLAIGGAQAIAAMAFGAGKVPRCDIIVGPGNRYVTAAKRLLSGRVGIDMLAGPSELLVIADDSANPTWVAADLLAQAEHDVDARPMLICLGEAIIPRIEKEIAAQLDAGMPNNFVVVVSSMKEAATISNRIAPEHLQLCVKDAVAYTQLFTSYGGLFVGETSAEVFGDYGFGPNHTLPTSGCARFTGGLSVLNFLRVQTFLQIDNSVLAREAADDARALAELEGLRGHAHAIAVRQRSSEKLDDLK